MIKETYDTTIILPTIDEVQNLQRLVPLLPYTIIVVDDSKNDETVNAAKALGCKTLKGDRAGLTAAIVKGISAATTDTVVVMDADCQHPPEAVKDILTALETHDVAIGCRYCKNGAVEGFTLVRRIVSRVSCIAVQPLVSTKDGTSGFFGMHKRCMPQIDTSVSKVLLEVLAVSGNLSIAEVPITFKLRHAGESKFYNSATIKAFATQVLRLYTNVLWNDLPHILKFGTVGFLGVFLNAILLLTFVDVFNLHYTVGALLSGILVIASKYVGNNIWSFAHSRKSEHTTTILKYLISLCIYHVIYITLMTLSVEFLTVHYIAASVIAIVLAAIPNYVMCRMWVWGSK